MQDEVNFDPHPQRRTSDRRDGYSNFELYEMINSLKAEIQQTTLLLRQYNGLGPRMDKLEQALVNLAKVQADCMTKSKAKLSMVSFIKEYAMAGLSALLASKALGWW